MDKPKKTSLLTVQMTIKPIPRGAGTEGCGEGCEYRHQGRFRAFHYLVGKTVPKNRVVSLKWEGAYRSRVHGDKEYIIVAWNGKDFTVLEYLYGESSSVRAQMKQYKSMTPAEAIKQAEDKNEKMYQDQMAHWKKMVKCVECGNGVVSFDYDQPKNVCFECHLKNKKRKVKHA